MAQSDAADAVQAALEHVYLGRAQLDFALMLAEANDAGPLTVDQLRALLDRYESLRADITAVYRGMA